MKPIPSGIAGFTASSGAALVAVPAWRMVALVGLGALIGLAAVLRGRLPAGLRAWRRGPQGAALDRRLCAPADGSGLDAQGWLRAWWHAGG